MEAFEQCVSLWSSLLKQATGFDSWGQLVEAEQEYEKLIKTIKQNADKVEMKYQMKILQKVVVCIRIRLSTIRGNDSDLEIPLEEIKRLNPGR